MSFRGRLALVTGGASVIGAAVSHALAEEGVTVVVADRQLEAAEQVVVSLSGDAKHQAIHVDVGDTSSVEQLFNCIRNSYSQPLSIVVNCAGVHHMALLKDTTEEMFDSVMRVNLKVLIYIACSGALTVLVMLFTLATVYGGRNVSRSASETSWRRFAESYPLVDQRPLLLEHGSLTQRLLDSTDDDDDDEQGAVGSDEEDVHTSSVVSQRDLDGKRTRSASYAPSEISEGPRSARWSLPGDLPQVIIKSKQSFKRPIEVFPSRLLDLCNQDAPLTFLAFLPNGNQHRSKWLAHGRNSEVFQVASVPRRTVLKVVPVSGDLTEQQVDTIASAIKCYLKLSTLKHGTHYRTPNFIEVERIACVFDQFPEWLLRSGNKDIASSSESLNESLASEMAGADGGSPDASDLLAAFRRWKGTNQCCLTRHFIVFELSYAGKPLSRITVVVLNPGCGGHIFDGGENAVGPYAEISVQVKEPQVVEISEALHYGVSHNHMLRSAVQGRSLVQQAACCLAVAERALGLRHTGVDADKLLVAMTDAASLEYRLPNRTTPISIESAGLKAHLAGCLSFAIDSEEDNDRHDAASKENVNDSPRSEFRRTLRLRATRSDRGAPRFYGNVMWLGAVMDCVLHKLRSELPENRGRAERDELISWQARLQQCNCVYELVDAMGL